MKREIIFVLAMAVLFALFVVVLIDEDEVQYGPSEINYSLDGYFVDQYKIFSKSDLGNFGQNAIIVENLLSADSGFPHAVLFDTNTGNVVWEYFPPAGQNADKSRAVAAKEGDIFLTISNKKINSFTADIVLRKFSSSSNIPDWEYVFPFNVHPEDSERRIDISDNGQVIVAAARNSNDLKTYIALFHPDSGVPYQYFSTTGIPFNSMHLSADGSTLVLHIGPYLRIFDLEPTPQQIYGEFLPGSGYTCSDALLDYSCVGVSEDGDKVALLRDNSPLRLQVLERNGQSYGEAYSEILDGLIGAGVWIPGDGETIVASSIISVAQHSNTTTYLYSWKDSGGNNYARTMEHVVLGYGGSQGWRNVPASISVSSYTERFIVGFTGDGIGSVKEYQIFSVYQDSPILQFDVVGSPFTVRESPFADGFVGVNKLVHANQIGTGTEAWFYSFSPAAPNNVIASDGAFPDKVRITWNSLGDVSYYEIWRSSRISSVKFSPIGKAPASATEFDDTRVRQGETYNYKVRAINALGFGEFSNEDSGFI